MLKAREEWNEIPALELGEVCRGQDRIKGL